MYTGSFGLASNRADWSFSVTLTDPENDDAPIDLTGASIEVAISEREALLPAVSGSTTDGKVTITSATAGEFSVTFPRSDMQTFEAGHYDVGIVVTLGSGTVHQLARGVLAISHGVVAAA